MSHSTPKLPVSHGLAKFFRKIDSFSFENSSPNSEPSTETHKEQGRGERTVQDSKIQEQNGLSSGEKESQNRTLPGVPGSSKGTEKRDERVVYLRKGRTYLRHRHNSTPGAERRKKKQRHHSVSSLRCVTLKHLNSCTNNSVLDNKNIDKNSVDIIKNPKSSEFDCHFTDKTNKNSVKSSVNSNGNMDAVRHALFNVVPLFGSDASNLSNEASAFLTCVKLAYDSLETPQQKTLFLNLLPTRLRGRALDSVQDTSFTSIEEFIQFIKSNFTDEKTYMEVNNELRLMQQLPGESLSSFFMRMKTQLARCKRKAIEQYPQGGDILATELEEMAINSFKLGIINPNHKFYLLQDITTTLDLLEPKVKRLEQSEKYMFFPNFATVQSPALINPLQNQMINKMHPNPTLAYTPLAQSTSLDFPYNNYNKSPAHDVNAQLSPIVGQTPQIQVTPLNSIYGNHRNSEHFSPNNSTGLNFKTKDRQIKCNFCNRLGHSYQDCRKRKAKTYCISCRAYGHSDYFCPLKQNNYARPAQGDNKLGQGRNRQVNMSQVDHEITGQGSLARCNFCLQEGHGEANCFAKVSWEKRQLEEKLKALTLGNGPETVDATPTSL